MTLVLYQPSGFIIAWSELYWVGELKRLPYGKYGTGSGGKPPTTDYPGIYYYPDKEWSTSESHKFFWWLFMWI